MSNNQASESPQKTDSVNNNFLSPAQAANDIRRQSIIEQFSEYVHERLKWATKLEFILSVLGFVVDLGNIWRFPYMAYRHGGACVPAADADEAGPSEHVTTEVKREAWGSKWEFLLAVVGFAVDLGNVWRFPYVCYRNGGGAFLIPYMVMFLAGGLPLFFLELALGQFHRSGCVSLWTHLCPVFKGIGIAIVIINSYVAFFYNTVLSWAMFFLFSSFRAEVPWATCNNTWNTMNCLTADDARQHQLAIFNSSSNETFNWTSPAQEFFEREVLQTDGHDFEDMGPIRWPLALCLLLVYIIVYFSMWKGPKSSGKAVWITATLPYVVLTVLLVRGVTLPGAWKGILYYLKPKWELLLERKVWIDAATQIFFSLGPGFGVLLALSSYNDFENNCFQDAIITSAINCVTSFLSGFVIFSVLGYMSHVLHNDVDKVAGEGGPGLIFIVYPNAIATMQGSSFWSIIFFIMLITLGLDSTYGGLEAIITGICDEFPQTIGRRRELFVLVLVIYCYFGSLPTTTKGGFYLIEFLDHYGVQLTVLFVVFVESAAVCWFYGVNRFSSDVHQMLGFRPGILWRACWLVISPLFIFIIFVFAAIEVKPLQIGSYMPPPWIHTIGWIVRCSSALCIPAYAVYRIAIAPGDTLMEKIKDSIKPHVDRRARGSQRRRGTEERMELNDVEPVVEETKEETAYQRVPDVIVPPAPLSAL